MTTTAKRDAPPAPVDTSGAPPLVPDGSASAPGAPAPVFRGLLQLFDRRERLKLLGVSLVLFFGSLLEVAGIGILLPFIKIVAEPALVLNDPRGRALVEALGIQTPRAVIITACLTLLALMVFKGIYIAAAMRVSYGFIYNKVLSLQKRLLTTYLRAPYLFHLRENTAFLVKNTVTETEHVGGILKFALFLPTEIIIVVGLVGLMLFNEPVTSLVGIVSLGGMMMALSISSRRELGRLGRIRAEQHGRMIQAVNQSLGGIKEVKLLGREQYFADALAVRGRVYTDALRRSTLITQYPRLLLETAAALMIVAFVLIVVLSGRDLQTVIGALALFGLATVRLVPSATRITNALHTLRFYAHSVTSVADGLRAAEHNPAAHASRAPMQPRQSIRLDGVSYRYPGAADDSLIDVHLEIAIGKRVAFVGSSGAGKTTLANLILGLLEPASGRILVDGVDIRENLRGWQDCIGYIPQDIYLSDESIRRNIAFGVPDDAIDERAVRQAVEAAQLADFISGLPDGLDTVVGERGARLSGGQRQRIGIARALYHDPDVLLLDEATSALDNETERLFAAAIDSLARRKTILIIAHRLSTVRNCDAIYLMGKGQIVDVGSYDRLFATQPMFAQLVEGRAPQHV